MKDTGHILLIGMRGCGKSTIGRLLAERLDCSFEDLDAHTLARFSEQSVTAVFHKHGEASWRLAEREALGRVLQLSPRVIALGGGTPMIDNVAVLIDQHRSQVIFLEASVDTLIQRMQQDPGDRPSLTDAGLIDELEGVLGQRKDVYDSLADYPIATDDKSAESVVDEIVATLAVE